MFTLPGTPVIRYGDELGMGDDLDLPERNCARTPMQWSTEPKRGFTKNSKPITPVISSGPYGYEHVNAAQQRREPNSMLNWTERMIRMRKEVPEIGWGDFQLLATGDESVLAIRYDWRNNSVVFVHNLMGTPREVEFRRRLARQRMPACWSISCRRTTAARATAAITCCSRAYGYRWFRVGGLDYLLKRSDD